MRDVYNSSALQQRYSFKVAERGVDVAQSEIGLSRRRFASLKMQADLTSQPRRVHEACSSTCCCEMSSEEAGRAFASVLMENLFNNERVSDELCNQGFTAFRLPSRHEGSKSVLSSSNHYVDKDSTIENENLKCQECYSGGARIAEELEHLYMKHTGDCGAKEELMQRNATQFGNGLIFHKPFIHEYDLHDSRSKSLQPTAYHCLDESRKWIANSASKDNVSSSDLHQQLGLGSDNHDAVSIKLQYNEGHGGCFPIHYDNPGGSSKRALTVLCYLNRSWFSDTNDSLGGEIVLLPFLSRNCYAFAPVMGLVVAFRSDIILHYTRPSQNRRLLMTIWIDGSRINLKEDMQITVKRTILSFYLLYGINRKCHVT